MFSLTNVAGRGRRGRPSLPREHDTFGPLEVADSRGRVTGELAIVTGKGGVPEIHFTPVNGSAQVLRLASEAKPKRTKAAEPAPEVA